MLNIDPEQRRLLAQLAGRTLAVDPGAHAERTLRGSAARLQAAFDASDEDVHRALEVALGRKEYQRLWADPSAPELDDRQWKKACRSLQRVLPGDSTHGDASLQLDQANVRDVGRPISGPAPKQPREWEDLEAAAARAAAARVKNFVLLEAVLEVTRATREAAVVAWAALQKQPDAVPEHLFRQDAERLTRFLIEHGEALEEFFGLKVGVPDRGGRISATALARIPAGLRAELTRAGVLPVLSKGRQDADLTSPALFMYRKILGVDKGPLRRTEAANPQKTRTAPKVPRDRSVRLTPPSAGKVSPQTDRASITVAPPKVSLGSQNAQRRPPRLRLPASEKIIEWERRPLTIGDVPYVLDALREVGRAASSRQSRAVAEIAAARFGIVVDPVSSRHLIEHAWEVRKSPQGQMPLYELSRFRQQPQGVLIAEDREGTVLVAWSLASTGSQCEIYTIRWQALLRTARDLVNRRPGATPMPVVSMTVKKHSLVETATSPLSLLCEAARELGRQAENRSRRSQQRTPKARTRYQTQRGQKPQDLPEGVRSGGHLWVRPVLCRLDGKLQENFGAQAFQPDETLRKSPRPHEVSGHWRREKDSPVDSKKTIWVNGYRKGRPGTTGTHQSGSRTR